MADKKRKHRIYARLSDDEYAQFLSKYQISNKDTINGFLLDCILDSRITSNSEIEEIRKINQQMADIAFHIKGACRNINQIARVANGTGYIDIEELKKQIYILNKVELEVERLWRLTRYSQAMLERKAQ